MRDLRLDLQNIIPGQGRIITREDLLVTIRCLEELSAAEKEVPGRHQEER